MSLLRSKSARVFFSDNGALIDATESTRTWGVPNFVPSWDASQDALYIGREHKFNHIYIALTEINTKATTLTAEYWDTSKKAWVAFEDFLDETSGFMSSGFIQWEDTDSTLVRGVRNWNAASPEDIAGLEPLPFKKPLFWLKLTLSATPDVELSIRAISKILSDDRLLKTIYPEVMSYLPTGQTDWLPQHELAKDEIVNTLILKGTIAYEDQIKNPDDWILPASYKTIELILAPIVGDERLTAMKDEMKSKAASTLRLSTASLDKNKNEDLDLNEVEPGRNQDGWVTR